MSNQADSFYRCHTLGHAISGKFLTTAEITHAAMTADLASGTAIDGELISDTNHEILQARIAQSVTMHADYNPGDIVNDHLHASLALDLLL